MEFVCSARISIFTTSSNALGLWWKRHSFQPARAVPKQMAQNAQSNSTYLPPNKYSQEPEPIPRSATGCFKATPPSSYLSHNDTVNRVDHAAGGNSQPRRWTQEDQDESDKKEKNKAMKDLVQSWMDRLQLISVITTFFAAMEAQLLGITAADSPADAKQMAPSDQAANAGLAGALVIHVFAAILSFFAAFFLVRFRLKEAKHDEHKAENQPSSDKESQKAPPQRNQPIFSSNPHLETYGPWQGSQPPTVFLEYCHRLCLWTSAVGFILAMAGVLCLAWARMPLSVSIFCSACAGTCLLAGVVTVIISIVATPASQQQI